MVGIKSDADIVRYLGNIATTIRKCVGVMPTHDQFIDHYCKAES